jgi:hypothetical protein
MYTRNTDQEIVPISTTTAIALALCFATLVAITALAVLKIGRDSNETQAMSVQELGK